jgi:S-(hydroxymethyl)glutathione dehydrogenase / alcohol dehydrogenase
MRWCRGEGAAAPEIDPMITHTLALPDINKGFELMHEGKRIRSVVLY